MAATVALIVFAGIGMPAGCEATPPTRRPGEYPTVGSGRYASLATCNPASGQQASCPGPSCGENALGAPDGTTIAMGSCGTLDAVFTGGVAVSALGEADLSVHVQQPVGGQTRVEASADGVNYVLVGFIGGAPAGTPSSCLTEVEGNEVLVDFDPCNLISNVGFLRMAFEAGSSGDLKVDAIEARSFRAR